MTLSRTSGAIASSRASLRSRAGRGVGTLLALLACSDVAPAAGCSFATAVYTQKESRYVLRFQPERELGRFPGTSNTFFVDRPGGGEPLLAWVIWNNGESRPNGRIMLDCPGDGMTNEDFEACTHWDGVMYALEGDTAVLLPMESEPPPARILLPDLGRQIRYSLLSGPQDETPWDVFEFHRCGEAPK